MPSRLLTTALSAVLATGVLAGPAAAAITPTRDANLLAGALGDSLPAGSLAGAAFVTIPPGGNPAAVADVSSSLTGFPTAGAGYAVLSSGDAQLADQAGTADVANDGGSGNPSHGDFVSDLVTLRVDLDVPSDANCLRIDFRFLSEEYPEFVGRQYNDAFIAELDVSDFVGNRGAAISAPNNFAFGPDGETVSVNTVNFAAEEAAGTIYNGATPRLRASTRIAPGRHSVFLSVFDQSDFALDSSAFIDALRLVNAPGDACATGATADVAAPAVSLSSPPNGSSSTDTTPLYSGTAGDAAGDSGTVTVQVFAGPSASGAPVQTLNVARSGAAWSLEGPALAPGTYTARAVQNDGAGNTGVSAPSTFGITSPPPPPDELPPPETGESVNVQAVKGRVTIKVPGGRTVRLEDAEQIPTGSVIDTRQGTVELTSTKAGGRTQTARFFDGMFRVTQTKGAKPLTNLELVEKLAACPRKGSGKKATTSARRKKRRLWGNGSGNFRTSGRRSSATVRGTKWMVQDDCAGTLTRVARGKVRVRDYKRKKWVLVRAGRTYRAR